MNAELLGRQPLGERALPPRISDVFMEADVEHTPETYHTLLSSQQLERHRSIALLFQAGFISEGESDRRLRPDAQLHLPPR